MSRPTRINQTHSWAHSVLVPHPDAPRPATSPLTLASFLALLKSAVLGSLLTPSASLVQRPKLPTPKPPISGSFRPPRPFHPQKSVNPIWYLLAESLESPRKRPVPHNAALLRSLCKGRGILRKSAEGGVYLDIAPQFMTAMMPYLRAPGLVRCPTGPHIPVIPEREMRLHFLDEVGELGAEISFELEGLYSIRPDAWPEAEEVWFFKVRSAELEAIRQRYFLPATPGGHPFHIAVAMQPRVGAERLLRVAPAMLRVNPGFLGV